jgi:Ca-activated chloride channel family protein
MKRYLFTLIVLLAYAGTARCGGLLIPVEPNIAPLMMLNHHVTVMIEDQVSVTTVKQTFRNHTDKKLEANYVFPVPEGASVKKFILFVNGKKMKAELLKAERLAIRMTANSGQSHAVVRTNSKLQPFCVLPTDEGLRGAIELQVVEL